MKIFGGKSKEIKDLQPDKPGQGGTDEKAGTPSLPAKLPEIKRPVPPATSMPVRSSRIISPESPPLFIKVDKYRNIVKNIRDLKSYLLNLRDALDVLEDMQKEVSNGIGIAHKSLDELNALITNLDSFFLKPQGVEHRVGNDIHEADDDDNEEVEGEMKDMYGQLEKLRAQLRAIR